MDTKAIADAIEADPQIVQARAEIALEKKKIIKQIGEIQSWARQVNWEPVPKMPPPNPTVEEIGARINIVGAWVIDKYYWADLYALAAGTRSMVLNVLQDKLETRRRYDWNNRTWAQRLTYWWRKK